MLSLYLYFIPHEALYNFIYISHPYYFQRCALEVWHIHTARASDNESWWGTTAYQWWVIPPFTSHVHLGLTSITPRCWLLLFSPSQCHLPPCDLGNTLYFSCLCTRVLDGYHVRHYLFPLLTPVTLSHCLCILLCSHVAGFIRFYSADEAPGFGQNLDLTTAPVLYDIQVSEWM